MEFFDFIIKLLYMWWDVPPIINFSVGLALGVFSVLLFGSCKRCELYQKEVLKDD